MSMTYTECIKMIEKQVEFALLGFVAEIEDLAEDLKEGDSLAEDFDTVRQIRAAVDAMEDMFEQLEDAIAEAKLMSELDANEKKYELDDMEEETKE